MGDALYTIGLDYGSLSCRGVLAALDGSVAAEAELAYPHGILEHALPDGTKLTGSWYLQHPADYVQALETVVPALLQQSGVSPEQVAGIGDESICQVHRGGVAVEACDSETMAVRDFPGLFIAGEALDVDGPCGGYNLHWAWSSGLLAGQCAARALIGTGDGDD